MKIGFTPKSKEDWRLLLKIVKILRLCNKAQLAKLVQCGELLLDVHPLSYNAGAYTPGEDQATVPGQLGTPPEGRRP